MTLEHINKQFSLFFKLLKKEYIKFHCKAYTSFLKKNTIKMELTESFAHLTSIIYVNLGRPHKSLFFSWIEIIHHPPWWKIISIIVIQTQQPIPHQHLGGLKAGCLEAGMLFHHYKMSVLEHHLTHWLKNKKRKFNSLLTNFLISIVWDIEHCQ